MATTRAQAKKEARVERYSLGKELRLVCDQILSCWTSPQEETWNLGEELDDTIFHGGETNWCKAEARSGKEGECIEQRYA